MTLDQAVAEFQGRFTEVVDYKLGDDPTSVRSTNNYFALTSAGPKREGEASFDTYGTPDVAISMWLASAIAQHARLCSGKILYWRTRPTMTEGRERTKPFPNHPMGRAFGPTKYSVYSRMTFA
jgi:hypothetical protein